MIYNYPICQILTTYHWKELSTSISFYACSRLHAFRTFLSLEIPSNIVVIEMSGYAEGNHRVKWEPTEINREDSSRDQVEEAEGQIAA